jgi:hypothetical protein
MKLELIINVIVKNWNFIKTIIILLLLSRLLSFETDKIALVIELLGSFIFLLGENISTKHLHKETEHIDHHLN